MARTLLACTLALAALPSCLQGQSARSLVQEGNRLYAEGRFQEAHEKYMEAMADAPESPVIPFNAGNALYQDADYRRAMEAYEQAIASGDAELASDAWYNLGNALYRQQQLQPSLEAYKQALRLDPSDVDAKHNLERVLQQMQQQQRQSEDDQQQEGGEGEDQQSPSEDRDQQEEGTGQQGQRSSEEGQSERSPPPAGQDPTSGEDEPQEGEGNSQDEPGEGEEPSQGEPGGDQGSGGAGTEQRPDRMTEEEARRLLAAIDEDPDEVNRRPPAATGRRPSKPW